MKDAEHRQRNGVPRAAIWTYKITALDRQTTRRQAAAAAILARAFFPLCDQCCQVPHFAEGTRKILLSHWQRRTNQVADPPMESDQRPGDLGRARAVIRGLRRGERSVMSTSAGPVSACHIWTSQPMV